MPVVLSAARLGPQAGTPRHDLTGSPVRTMVMALGRHTVSASGVASGVHRSVCGYDTQGLSRDADTGEVIRPERSQVVGRSADARNSSLPWPSIEAD